MSKKQLPIVSFILLGLNILAFIYESSEGETVTMLRYAMYEGALKNGEWLRVLTSAFFHFGWYHLACNMFCLISFGFTLERRIGPMKYLIVYMIAIVGSGLLINYTGGNGIHAGASGAIWGLMTATLVYNIRNELSTYDALRCILVNLIYSFSAGVSWQGHIGGGIAGLIIALIMFTSKNGSSGSNGRIYNGGNQYNGNISEGQQSGSTEYWS